MLSADDGRRPAGDRAVVERVVEAVAGPGGAQVGLYVEVDLERLRPDLLLGQHAVGAHHPQPAQLDTAPAGRSVHHRVAERATSSRPTGPICRAASCSITVTVLGALSRS